MNDQPTADFNGCNSECRKAGKHSLRWSGCEHATPPEPTVSMSVVYTDPADGYPAIGFDTYTVPQLAELIEPALRTIKISLGPNARALLERGQAVGLSAGEYASLALAAADAIVHRHDEERPAVPVSSPPPDQTALRDRIAAVLREHYLSTNRNEADADGNLPCRCGAWREPGVEVDDENDWDAHLADALLAVLPPPPDRTAEEAYRLALSTALRLGTGANWEAIRDQAEDLVAEVGQLTEASRRLLEQRQEMAKERFAWQERGDRAEARVRQMEAAPADRAAVLLWAADHLAAMDPVEAALAGQHAWQEAAKELRRLAAEAQQQCPGVETVPNRCTCDCEGCKHHCGAHQPAVGARQPDTETPTAALVDELERKADGWREQAFQNSQGLAAALVAIERVREVCDHLRRVSVLADSEPHTDRERGIVQAVTRVMAALDKPAAGSGRVAAEARPETVCSESVAHIADAVERSAAADAGEEAPS